MAHPRGRAWKLERGTVHVKGKNRPRSNKYSASDSSRRPEPGVRQQVWVGGYVRSDGTKVQGHYRKLHPAKG